MTRRTPAARHAERLRIARILATATILSLPLGWLIATGIEGAARIATTSWETSR